jgi:eukaryotic-like serine/threonine-protein kinase
VRSVAPTVIAGRYEVGELLGRGGMAEVYAGVDRRLERPVAVKLLQERMAARADVRTRFEAEAKAAATLTQPHAVAVFDTGEHDGVPFIVMERLPGHTLADRIAEGPLPQEDVRAIAAQVLGALGAAHAAGIVHRDVKPGNILVAADGSVKIADFGIAKSIDVAADLTSTGQVLGTPAYLAPEQVEGQRAGPASDLYSLGVVLYEALTGQKPFGGPTPVAVAQAVVAGEHRPLSDLRPDVDPPLADAVERAMSRDPEKRFPSAATMAAALSVLPPTMAAPIPLVDDTQALDATSILAAPPPPSPSTAPPPAPPFPSTSDDPGPPPPGRRPRPGPWVVVLAAAALLALLVLARALGSGGEPGRTSTTSTTQVSALAGLADRMRDFADGLSQRDGDAWSDLAHRMRSVADQVQAGGGRPAATKLAADVVEWQDNGDLTDRAAMTALGLLTAVPGVSAPATTAAPTTEAPTTEPTPPPTSDVPATVAEQPTIVIEVPNIGDVVQDGRKGKKGR